MEVGRQLRRSPIWPLAQIRANTKCRPGFGEGFVQTGLMKLQIWSFHKDSGSLFHSWWSSKKKTLPYPWSKPFLFQFMVIGYNSAKHPCLHLRVNSLVGNGNKAAPKISSPNWTSLDPAAFPCRSYIPVVSPSPVSLPAILVASLPWIHSNFSTRESKITCRISDSV